MRISAHNIMLFAGVIVWVAFSTCSMAFAEERIWRDSTGSFEVRATLLNVKSDSVVLKRTDGRVVDVSLDRLSKSDREHIESLQRKNPFAARTAPTEVAKSLVLVSCKAGKRTYLRPGFVFRHDKGRAYVRVRGTWPPSVTGEPLEFAILRTGSTGVKQVKAALAAEFPRLNASVVSTPAAEMPPPLKPVSGIKIEKDMPVTVVGYSINTAGATPSFARIVSPASVKAIYHSTTGEIFSFRLEGDHITDLRGALVLDAQVSSDNYFSLSATTIFPGPENGGGAVSDN